jgi:hypothetical protein
VLNFSEPMKQLEEMQRKLRINNARFHVGFKRDSLDTDNSIGIGLCPERFAAELLLQIEG